jgi:outer membrane protein assembly factor BamB
MIHAVEKATGDVRWTADSVAAIWGAPAFGDGIVFYADLNGNVYAVDGETGQQIWSDSFNNYTVAAPIVKDGVVYIALAGSLDDELDLRNGSLVALDAKSGDEIWRESTDAPIFTTPVFINENIVVAFVNQEILNLVVYDSEEGDELWTFRPTISES